MEVYETRDPLFRSRSCFCNPLLLTSVQVGLPQFQIMYVAPALADVKSSRERMAAEILKWNMWCFLDCQCQSWRKYLQKLNNVDINGRYFNPPVRPGNSLPESSRWRKHFPARIRRLKNMSAICPDLTPDEVDAHAFEDWLVPVQPEWWPSRAKFLY